jgi:hypothetical protein
MPHAVIADAEQLAQRVTRLSPDKQRTIAIVLENLESWDNDASLEQEIAEFQAMSRPLSQPEKTNLLKKISRV